jgi:hypothetical protein
LIDSIARSLSSGSSTKHYRYPPSRLDEILRQQQQ